MSTSKKKSEVTGMYSIATMNNRTYDKLQECLGVNFEAEAKRLQELNSKKKKK